MTGPQTTLITSGPMAEMQRDLFMVTVAVGAFIFVAVGGILAYAQFRYRARPENANDPVPEQTHGNPLVEISLIFASIALLVIIAIPTVRGIRMMGTVPDAESALRIRATGYQWWFRFDYPDQAGLITANEMVLPAGRPVRVDLRTQDVIHSFWVPRLAGKIDMIRNRPNWLWLQADEPGYYWGHCAEFCGDSHTYMRFRVVVLPPSEWDAWVMRQQASARIVDPGDAPTVAARPPAKDTAPQVVQAGFFPARPRATADALIEAKWQEFQQRQAGSLTDEAPALVAQGRKYFQEMGCIGCHTVRGHEGVGVTAPDLTHFASRTTLAAAVLDNTPDNLKRWLRENNTIKPGNLMWKGYTPQAKAMTDEQADALVAYLQSLR